MKIATIASATLLAALAPAVLNAQTVATIYGIYDASGCASLPAGVTSNPSIHNTFGCTGADDTPSLFFVNPSTYDIINPVMVLSVTSLVNSGQTTLNEGLTQTLTLDTFAANSITQIRWGGSLVRGNLASFDYDDEWQNWIFEGPPSGNRTLAGNSGSFSEDCTLNTIGGHPEWTQYCAPVGNFKVEFTGTLSGAGASNGVGVAALFAELDVDGHYSGWEGLDAKGWSENADVDVHSGTVTGVLANIQIGSLDDIHGSPLTATPEPSTIVLVASGLGGIVTLRRRRNRKTQ